MPGLVLCSPSMEQWTCCWLKIHPSPLGGVNLAVRSVTAPGTVPLMQGRGSTPVVSSPVTGLLSPSVLRARMLHV